MNTLEAARETLALADTRGYADISFEIDGVDAEHLASMFRRIEGQAMSEGKINRWLGYMQGVLVANGCLTLAECKDINRRHAEGTEQGDGA